MKIEELLLEEDKSFVINTVKKIFKGGMKAFIQKVENAINQISDVIKKLGVEKQVVDIIKQRAGINISKVTDLKKSLHTFKVDESKQQVNESFSEWWQEATTNAYGALAFYPLLTMFLEFDKVIKDAPGASIRVTLIYFAIWVLVISGKIIHKDWLKKKKTKEWDSRNPYGDFVKG